MDKAIPLIELLYGIMQNIIQNWTLAVVYSLVISVLFVAPIVINARGGLRNLISSILVLSTFFVLLFGWVWQRMAA